jgi:hypothetical protein
VRSSNDRYNFLAKAEPQSALGIICAGCKHHNDHASRSDDPADADRSTAAGKNRPLTSELSEKGRSVRDAGVTCRSQFQSTSDHGPLQRADDRQSAELHLVECPVREADVYLQTVDAEVAMTASRSGLFETYGSGTSVATHAHGYRATRRNREAGQRGGIADSRHIGCGLSFLRLPALASAPWHNASRSARAQRPPRIWNMTVIWKRTIARSDGVRGQELRHDLVVLHKAQKNRLKIVVA